MGLFGRRKEEINMQSPTTYHTEIMTNLLDNYHLYNFMLQNSNNLANSQFLACMISSSHQGQSFMPLHLGLDETAFELLLQRHFNITQLPIKITNQQLPQLPEADDLRQLFMRHRADDDIERSWIAEILITACAGNNHLWQDLGLWQRADLTALIQRNFPSLAAQNTFNMKWKKFFYKQLCLAEGVYVCRAPSCAVCTDYAACFGTEE
jgi:nitrogen fixation protein NifQ